MGLKNYKVKILLGSTYVQNFTPEIVCCWILGLIMSFVIILSMYKNYVDHSWAQITKISELSWPLVKSALVMRLSETQLMD